MTFNAIQAADELRWWLRLPPTNLIDRRDHIRFRHAVYLIIHQIASVLYGVNGMADEMYFPSRLSGAQTTFDDLPHAPVDAGRRLAESAGAADERHAWQIAAAMIEDTLRFTDGGTVDPFEKMTVPGVSPSPDAMRARASAVAQYVHGLVGVEAVMLGGSLARGAADAQSDIDLHVFCTGMPAESDRQALITSWPDVQHPPLIEPACDTVLIGGAMMHIRYWLSEEVDRQLEFRAGADLNRLLAEEMQIGEALFDPDGRIRSWKQQTDAPPRALIAAMIEQARLRRPLFSTLWQQAAARHDVIHQYCLINQAVHDWLTALYIRNGRFISTPRWTHREMASLPIIPDDTGNRLIRLVGVQEGADAAENRWHDLDALWQELPELPAHEVF